MQTDLEKKVLNEVRALTAEGVLFSFGYEKSNARKDYNPFEVIQLRVYGNKLTAEAPCTVTPEELEKACERARVGLKKLREVNKHKMESPDFMEALFAHLADANKNVNIEVNLTQ